MSLPGLLVVGTDTGVGKTQVAAAIVRALAASGRRVGVMKPVATGATRLADGWQCDDARRLIASAGGAIPLQRVTPLLYEESLAPAVAARRTGHTLSPEHVERVLFETIGWWDGRADVMVVEGIGGLLCPLAEGTTVADLAVALDYPLVVVARRGLGTLNHTLLTVEAARLRSLRIAGLVLNSPEPETGSLAEATSAEELARRLPGMAVLTVLPHAGEQELSERVGAVDWNERAARPRCRADRATRTTGCAARNDSTLRGVSTSMPSDVIEPPSDASSKDRDLSPRPPGSVDARADASARPEEARFSVEASSGSTSGDELSAILVKGRPDPLLGEFVAPTEPEAGSSEATPAEQPDAPGESAAASGAVPPFVPASTAHHGQGSYDPLTGRASEPLAGDIPNTGSSADALAALGLDTNLESSSSTHARTYRQDAPVAARDDDEDETPARGVSWPMVLLASYASAVTIGLVWVLWTGRTLSEPGSADLPFASDTRPDPGHRAGRSRRTVARPAVLAANMVGLGRSLHLGQVEVTPLSVSRGPVMLERSLAGAESKSGGVNALKLRIRIRNVSPDRVLAPLDEAYLREREPGSPDSFIETSSGHSSIEPFPLAVESEWSIQGQEFRELKPGETLETLVVSAPDAASLITPEMTWRIRLRTDINHTDDLGVRFHADDVRAEP